MHDQFRGSQRNRERLHLNQQMRRSPDGMRAVNPLIPRQPREDQFPPHFGGNRTFTGRDFGDHPRDRFTKGGMASDETFKDPRHSFNGRRGGTRDNEGRGGFTGRGGFGRPNAERYFNLRSDAKDPERDSRPGMRGGFNSRRSFPLRDHEKEPFRRFDAPRNGMRPAPV